MRRLVPLWCVAAVVGGCAQLSSGPLKPDERSTVEREIAASSARYLRLSFYVTPFFGDGTKRLLTALPPKEVVLVNHPNGAAANPCDNAPKGQSCPERTLPAGTRVELEKVEFPPLWLPLNRVAYTPKERPWVYLHVVGDPADAPPLILPLAPDIDSPGRFLAELERFVTAHDPEPTLAGWSDAIRAAVQQKTTLPQMPAEAVEMSLGYPELKVIKFEGPVKREEWFYPRTGGTRRVAVIADGKLSAVETREAQ